MAGHALTQLGACVGTATCPVRSRYKGEFTAILAHVFDVDLHFNMQRIAQRHVWMPTRIANGPHRNAAHLWTQEERLTPGKVLQQAKPGRMVDNVYKDLVALQRIRYIEKGRLCLAARHALQPVFFALDGRLVEGGLQAL